MNIMKICATKNEGVQESYKGWKECDSKTVYLDGYYLADFYTVEEAKDFVKFKLLQTYNDIGAMLYE